MGGAAFPTGRKWSLVAEASADCRYVICNADESEPGAFKDREILHDLPHLVIEGMALAAHELDARRGWIFIRHEYRPERDALEAALQQAREEGALGPSILGTDFSFDIEIFVSPGGYILGEETALLECLEDRRGEPRNKPPFPGQVGLFGCPTLINNVETYAHATAILHRGAAWWHSLGRQGFTGHKFLSVSGDVTHPGVSLVPFGTTIREVLELCGGMLGGQELETFAPGGASSRFLGPEHLDTPVDFDALADAGSMLGAGSLVFVAKGRDLLDIGLNVTRFFRNESCGKCVPCRVGIEKALEHIDRHGSGQSETAQLLTQMHETLERTSLCGLGQVALSPLLSLLERVPATRSRE
jgi:NADH:ubiquinone oxidoreductase subunit F (NADH-binding)